MKKSKYPSGQLQSAEMDINEEVCNYYPIKMRHFGASHTKTKRFKIEKKKKKL